MCIFFIFLHSSRFFPCCSLARFQSLTISIFFIYISFWIQKMIFVVCLFVCLFLYLKKREREWRCETWESDNGILRFLPSFPLFLSLFEMSLLPNYFLLFKPFIFFYIIASFYLFFSLFRFKFDFSLLTYLSRTQKI